MALSRPIQEVIVDSIMIPLQYQDIVGPLNLLLDDEKLAWPVAKVKENIISQSKLGDVKEPPEFLDLVILVGGGRYGENIMADEITLRDNYLLGRYRHDLCTGHKLLLRKRRVTWIDYLTYLKRRTEETILNPDVCLAIVLFVAVVLTSAYFGMYNVEDILLWHN